MQGVGAIVGSGEWFSRPESEWNAAELLLAHGAAIIAEKRASVRRKLGYTVSAGAPPLPPLPPRLPLSSQPACPTT